MSNPNSISNESNGVAMDGVAKSTETRLRGEALNGAEQKAVVDHTNYEASRDPDTELRLDGEDDRLYVDGLDIDK
jgi:hypothetical protein